MPSELKIDDAIENMQHTHTAQEKWLFKCPLKVRTSFNDAHTHVHTHRYIAASFIRLMCMHAAGAIVLCHEVL